MNKDDAVNHPRHYTNHPSGVECIELIENMSFCVGNTLKYVFRSDEKGAPLQDVKKALWYLEREIERRQRESWGVYPTDPRYEVSTLGRVRRIGSSEVRALVPIKNGYLTFMTVIGSKHVLHYVHRAVALTFLGDIPDEMVVCHNDGIRSNNQLLNLRLDTVQGNLSDRRLHGTHFVGEQNPMAKLTPDDVRIIRSRVDSADSQLAEEFDVSVSTIKRIKSGVAWADPRTRQELAVAAFLDHEPRPHIRAAVEALWRAAIVTTGTVEDLVAARQHIQNELSTRHADERPVSSSNTQEAPKKRKATKR